MSNLIYNIKDDPEEKELAFRKNYLFSIQEIIESMNLTIEHYKFDNGNDYLPIDY